MEAAALLWVVPEELQGLLPQGTFHLPEHEWSLVVGPGVLFYPGLMTDLMGAPEAGRGNLLAPSSSPLLWGSENNPPTLP